MSAKMELLKKIAKENGVTIDQMAASAGISTATLYRKIKAGAAHSLSSRQRRLPPAPR